MRSLTAVALFALALPAMAGTVLTSEEQAAGWTLLFDGTSLKGWRPYGKPAGMPIGEGSKVDEGLLHKLPGVKGGDIIT